jgi:hypothetical protein
MDQPHIAISTHSDGWTPERKALFLEALGSNGNVRAACASVGMSREAAYKLRRREALFMRGWEAALALARENVAEIFGDRAIDGIEEEVWYRGELKGTRRRLDARLMLAHMARLDKLVEKQACYGDVERFDEILACIAGATPPEGLEREEDDLPPARHEHVGAARAAARERVGSKWADEADENGEFGEEDHAAFAAESEAEAERAALEAAVVWDQWHARACAAVDALRAADFTPGLRQPVSGVSTSPGATDPFSAGWEGSRTG